MLRGKKIILGVCGSVAAYKTPIFLRLLLKAGAEVRVALTPDAASFVSPLVLQTLSGHELAMNWTQNENQNQWHNHVEWGCWADLFIIAPASANTIHHLAQGAAPHFLAALYLSARCPVMIAPAMDHDMFLHPSVKRNIEQLQKDGCHIIPPEHGELASGLIGEGRLPEPERLMEQVNAFFFAQNRLKNITILITSGPTREPIDPVRYISNHSSGKMGAAMADAATSMGANVIFISGPAQVYPRLKPWKFIQVETALQMFEAVKNEMHQAQWFFMAAAVADKRPEQFFEGKLKKDRPEMQQIRLMDNPDILAYLGEHRAQGTILTGFALETENGIENARQKLNRKKADFICLNIHNPAEGTGFGSDQNQLTILGKNSIQVLEKGDKFAVASALLNYIRDYENLD